MIKHSPVLMECEKSSTVIISPLEDPWNSSKIFWWLKFCHIMETRIRRLQWLLYRQQCTGQKWWFFIQMYLGWSWNFVRSLLMTSWRRRFSSSFRLTSICNSKFSSFKFKMSSSALAIADCRVTNGLFWLGVKVGTLGFNRLSILNSWFFFSDPLMNLTPFWFDEFLLNDCVKLWSFVLT